MQAEVDPGDEVPELDGDIPGLRQVHHAARRAQDPHFGQAEHGLADSGP